MATAMQFLIHATVDGQQLGVFDTHQGGDAVAKEVKHRPGGMGPEVAYVSLPSYSTITVTRVMQRTRDWALEKSLIPKAGKVTGSVTIQPLDDDGNTWGDPMTYSGKFLGVKPPKTDSNSETVAMWELDFEIVTIS